MSGIRILAFQVPNNAPCPLKGMPTRITAAQADMEFDPQTGAVLVRTKDGTKTLFFVHGAWLEVEGAQ